MLYYIIYLFVKNNVWTEHNMYMVVSGGSCSLTWMHDVEHRVCKLSDGSWRAMFSMPGIVNDIQVEKTKVEKENRLRILRPRPILPPVVVARVQHARLQFVWEQTAGFLGPVVSYIAVVSSFEALADRWRDWKPQGAGHGGDGPIGPMISLAKASLTGWFRCCASRFLIMGWMANLGPHYAALMSLVNVSTQCQLNQTFRQFTRMKCAKVHSVS